MNHELQMFAGFGKMWNQKIANIRLNGATKESPSGTDYAKSFRLQKVAHTVRGSSERHGKENHRLSVLWEICMRLGSNSQNWHGQ